MRRSFLFLLIALLMNSCGTEIDSPDGSIIAPPGSTITIAPGSFTANIGGPVSYYTHTFSVYVEGPDERPVGRARLLIQYPWAHPQSDYFYFYDGVCSPSMPPANRQLKSPFEATTDDYGVYSFCVMYAGGQIGTDPDGNPIYLEYYGDIGVRSGTNFGTARFEVRGPS